jgi:hypothetical protein
MKIRWATTYDSSRFVPRRLAEIRTIGIAVVQGVNLMQYYPHWGPEPGRKGSPRPTGRGRIEAMVAI